MPPRENESGEPRAAGAGTGADPRMAGTAGPPRGRTGAGRDDAGRDAAAATGSGSGGAERALPAPGFAEVSIVAATPEAARRIAQVLRFRFAATEQPPPGRPVVDEDGGTRLRLTVDTVHFPDAGPFQLRLVGGEERVRDGTGTAEVTGVTGVTEAAQDADATQDPDAAQDPDVSRGTDVTEGTAVDGVPPAVRPPSPPRPPRPAPNTRLAPPTTPDEPSGDRPTP
ncbi:hypothetical protein [Streptomyces sp. NPDC008317]|uniref:hypothetical protein n=1 Tax=Streptomyces sp. NPDC008317 TaxID=3364827 RepID=UPI0036E8A4DB